MDDSKLGTTIKADMPPAADLRLLLTSKNGKLARSVTFSKGVVKRPLLDEEGSHFVSGLLEPLTGQNFTGQIRIRLDDDDSVLFYPREGSGAIRGDGFLAVIK